MTLSHLISVKVSPIVNQGEVTNCLHHWIILVVNNSCTYRRLNAGSLFPTWIDVLLQDLVKPQSRVTRVQVSSNCTEIWHVAAVPGCQ